MEQLKTNFAHPLYHRSWRRSTCNHSLDFVLDTLKELGFGGDQKIMNNWRSAVVINFVFCYRTQN
jgi:hypothetical protein